MPPSAQDESYRHLPVSLSGVPWPQMARLHPLAGAPKGARRVASRVASLPLEDNTDESSSSSPSTVSGDAHGHDAHWLQQSDHDDTLPSSRSPHGPVANSMLPLDYGKYLGVSPKQVVDKGEPFIEGSADISMSPVSTPRLSQSAPPSPPSSSSSDPSEPDHDGDDGDAHEDAFIGITYAELAALQAALQGPPGGGPDGDPDDDDLGDDEPELSDAEAEELNSLLFGRLFMRCSAWQYCECYYVQEIARGQHI